MNVDEIFDLITRHRGDFVARLKDHQFQKDDSLRQLGVNSVDRSEIIMMTLESLSLNIPLIRTAKTENIGELAHIIYENQQHGEYCCIRHWCYHGHRSG